MAYTANLYKINHTYYFRVRIPKDLKKWFGQQDFKRSLRTKLLASARGWLFSGPLRPRDFLQPSEQGYWQRLNGLSCRNSEL